jgi:hypothetical protein
MLTLDPGEIPSAELETDGFSQGYRHRSHVCLFLLTLKNAINVVQSSSLCSLKNVFLTLVDAVVCVVSSVYGMGYREVC